jgi:hypothetical protein
MDFDAFLEGRDAAALAELRSEVRLVREAVRCIFDSCGAASRRFRTRN